MKALPLIAVFVMLCTTLCGAELEKKTESTKDEFLRFALEKARQYTGAAENAVSSAVDMAQREAPELAKEWIRWRTWYHALCFAPGLLGLGVSLWFVRLFFKKGGFEDFDSFPIGMTALILSMLSLMTMVAWGPHILKFVLVTVAPRIYIAEQLIEIIK
jgi:hypothetical protein